MIYFRNYSGAIIWSLSVVWMSMLLAMTFVVYRDGPPPSTSIEMTLAVFAFFWLGGIAVTSIAASKCCFHVKLESEERVLATWRYPFRVVQRILRREDLRAAVVVDSQDSEGGCFYFARVVCADGVTLDLTEGRNRAKCERTCSHFNKVLFPGNMDVKVQ